jgi:hypothetical protein
LKQWGNLLGRHGMGQVLLVAQYQERETLEEFLLEEALQFMMCHVSFIVLVGWVVNLPPVMSGIYDKDDGIQIGNMNAPGLTTQTTADSKEEIKKPGLLFVAVEGLTWKPNSAVRSWIWSMMDWSSRLPILSSLFHD